MIFTANIATTSDAFGGVGRADYLAANIAAARAGAENSVFVSAGDLIGASPLISALFHDEPTIEAMNLMGSTSTASATTNSMRVPRSY